MKLSEAIRKGATQVKPVVERLVIQNVAGEICGCALGAALVAHVGPSKALDLYANNEGYTFLEGRHPELILRNDRGTLEATIISMFDHEDKTMRQVADYVESLGY